MLAHPLLERARWAARQLLDHTGEEGGASREERALTLLRYSGPAVLQVRMPDERIPASLHISLCRTKGDGKNRP